MPGLVVPFLLGLTGNIACGKSSIGALLAAECGAEYVDADRVVHELYRAGTPETQAIAERFGAHLLRADGTIDRRRLGDAVMADPAARLDLERILDPSVRTALLRRISASPAPVVVLDAIRLFESGLGARCDAVWVVTCDPDEQVARLQRTRGLTAEQAALRVRAQGAQADKARQAHVVLTNTGSLEDLQRQVREAWQTTVASRLR